MSPSVVVVGVSHRPTGAALRERLYLGTEDSAACAQEVAGTASEAVVVATCNRTEVYLAGAGPAEMEHHVALAVTGWGADVAPHAYAYRDDMAATHLFRVCAGLDALVLGDTHVTAQVREAHGAARAAGATGPAARSALRGGPRCTKRIRSETTVCSGHTSVPSVAIATATRIAGTLSERRLLVVGAGSTAQAAAQNAAWRGCHDVVILNRDAGRARALAERVGGRAAPPEALAAEVAAADIVISATSAPGFILAPDHLGRSAAFERQRPLLVLDLAIPRDVDPAVPAVPRARLVDLDDLAQILAASGARRSTATARAEAIAREEAVGYDVWRRARRAVPAIVALRAEADQTRGSILDRHATALARLDPEELGLVETITSELVAKLLHEPIVKLRRLALERSA
jgi:glutamyl-tRNA reductase